MIGKACAFLLGMWEFRQSFTTRVNYSRRRAYDSGREWAHRITFRLYES